MPRCLCISRRTHFSYTQKAFYIHKIAIRLRRSSFNICDNTWNVCTHRSVFPCNRDVSNTGTTPAPHLAKESPAGSKKKNKFDRAEGRSAERNAEERFEITQIEARSFCGAENECASFRKLSVMRRSNQPSVPTFALIYLLVRLFTPYSITTRCPPRETFSICDDISRGNSQASISSSIHFVGDHFTFDTFMRDVIEVIPLISIAESERERSSYVETGGFVNRNGSRLRHVSNSRLRLSFFFSYLREHCAPVDYWILFFFLYFLASLFSFFFFFTALYLSARTRPIYQFSYIRIEIPVAIIFRRIIHKPTRSSLASLRATLDPLLPHCRFSDSLSPLPPPLPPPVWHVPECHYFDYPREFPRDKWIRAGATATWVNP